MRKNIMEFFKILWALLGLLGLILILIIICSPVYRVELLSDIKNNNFGIFNIKTKNTEFINKNFTKYNITNKDFPDTETIGNITLSAKESLLLYKKDIKESINELRLKNFSEITGLSINYFYSNGRQIDYIPHDQLLQSLHLFSLGGKKCLDITFSYFIENNECYNLVINPIRTVENDVVVLINNESDHTISFDVIDIK